MTILLALDTSTRQMGLALYDGTQVLSEMMWVSQFHHTTQLAPAVARMLDIAGYAMEDIEVLGVATGPGSFTSLRVGMAFAKGIALAQRIPLLGIPTLDALAHAQPLLDIPMLAILEAGRKRLAIGTYHVNSSRWVRNGDYQLLTADALVKTIESPTYICGEMSESVRKTLGRRWKNAQLASPAQTSRRAGYLAELAWARWEQGESDNADTLAPLYLLADHSTAS